MTLSEKDTTRKRLLEDCGNFTITTITVVLIQKQNNFKEENHPPLPNLLLTIIQKMGVETETVRDATRTQKPDDPKDKYVSALAGSDIQTNPPATNEAVQAMAGKTFTRQVDQLPAQEILDEIDQLVNFQHLEETLMQEDLKKFADPQNALLALIAEKRESLTK